MRRFHVLALLTITLAALARNNAAAQEAKGDGALSPRALFRLGTTFLRQGGWISSLAYSPDGRMLAGYAPGEQIVLWDVKACKRLHTFTVPTPSHRWDVLAFSPDGRWFVALGQVDSRKCQLFVW